MRSREGRQVDGKDVEAVVEVFPEGGIGHGLLQVPVGGGQQPDVGLQGGRAAQTGDTPAPG